MSEAEQSATRPPAAPAGELFVDPGARAVWAAIIHMEEAIQHQLLAALRDRLSVPEARVNPDQARVARAVAALREAAELTDGSGAGA